LDPTSKASISERLRLLRKALGHTQVTMGKLAGASANAWQNYETEINRISLDAALALCASTGLTLDWIYRGRIESLPKELAEKIINEMKRG
jgi:transcriptional regulator with XRE-family HTH domain